MKMENIKECCVCLEDKQLVKLLCEHEICIDCKNKILCDNNLLKKCPLCRMSLHKNLFNSEQSNLNYDLISIYNLNFNDRQQFYNDMRNVMVDTLNERRYNSFDEIITNFFIKLFGN